MKNKSVLITAPFFLVLVTVSLFATPVAASVGTDKAFVFGTVNFFSTPDGDVRAWGLVLATATEPDRASVCMFFFIPVYKEMMFIKLVEPVGVSVCDKGIDGIAGYWNVYINCKLTVEGVRGFFTTEPGWKIWEINFETWPVYIAGSVICHRYQPGPLVP